MPTAAYFDVGRACRLCRGGRESVSASGVDRSADLPELAVSEIRYVGTDEIKKAIAGQETDVLDAIGIDWRGGRPHIQCPYPDHADNDPAWRWDQPEARVYCTCTTNSHADGIFDVIGRVKQIGFEETKSGSPNYCTAMT